jgi:hypothetical protein
VARCLLITQRVLVLEHEPRFFPQVCPCDQTMLKFRLKWSTTWWRGVEFYRRRYVDRWILAGGIARFSIAYSSGFIVRISMRANPDDWVVVDEVPIGGHVGASTGSVVTGCLTTAWNVVVEFLRLRGNSKPIIVVSHASCSWVGCSRRRSSYSDHRRVSLWMTTFRTGTACPSETSRRKSTMSWVHKDESQCSPLPDASLTMFDHQIFRVESEGMHIGEINLMWT